MERIIVKALKPFNTAKGQGLEVLMNGNRKATVAAWHSQEQNYIMNDVGIGGSFEADIVVKGDYTNIENVKFDSAEKAHNPSHEAREGTERPITESEKISDVPTCKIMSAKDEIIVAQVILKGAVELANNKLPAIDGQDNEKLGEFLCMAVNELTGAYKLALSNMRAL